MQIFTHVIFYRNLYLNWERGVLCVLFCSVRMFQIYSRYQVSLDPPPTFSVCVRLRPVLECLVGIGYYPTTPPSYTYTHSRYLVVIGYLRFILHIQMLRAQGHRLDDGWGCGSRYAGETLTVTLCGLGSLLRWSY